MRKGETVFTRDEKTRRMVEWRRRYCAVFKGVTGAGSRTSFWRRMIPNQHFFHIIRIFCLYSMKKKSRVTFDPVNLQIRAVGYVVRLQTVGLGHGLDCL
jgi:hypothetical protein